ncbi:MAG: 3'-5' exonuclease, partial [Pseudomonadota bacterium]
DEAQDTSRLQWSIARQLAGEFFSQDDDRALPRSVFAVGDEKQSIYSFQGAEPALFAAAGSWFSGQAAASGRSFASVPLTLSFRTVAPVLEAVDAVFADPARTPGLTQDARAIAHKVKRAGDGGHVEVWSVPEYQPPGDVSPFQPLDDESGQSPIADLSNQIAETIATWLRDKRHIAARGRPVRPSDILILLKRRRPLGPAIISALKDRGIPVAGADRMVLLDQLVVQDLMALGDFLTLPENDLALANVLKSPLFDFDDDDLIRIATGARGSLWSELIKSAQANVRDHAAAEVLKAWRKSADYRPPFEYLAALLDQSSHLDPGMTYRSRLLRRLGPEAADPLDEFLELALAYDDQASPSLIGFLAWLRSHPHEIKRDMEAGQEQVRLMTVHGAKGLEAPIVILPDTTSNPTPSSQERLLDLQLGDADTDVTAGTAPERIVWTIPPSKFVSAIADAKDARKAATVAESNRLLYVAMTRAEDELYVCGRPVKSLSPHSWYALVTCGLEPLLTEATGALGQPVLRYAHAQTAELPDSRAGDRVSIAETIAKPDWMRRPAPAEPRLQIPVQPSRLAPLETDESGDPIDAPPEVKDAAGNAAPAAPSPQHLASDNRFLRGTITHALLQYLPDIASADRAHAAEAFIAARATALRHDQRASILSETLAVVGDDRFASAFGPNSRAEVSIAVSLPNPRKGQPPLEVSGQIDRLVTSDHEVAIIDFKSNRPPPRLLDDVAETYVLQLSAYRLAIGAIFPGKKVRTALLWTDGARLMEVPEDMLVSVEPKLWRAVT